MSRIPVVHAGDSLSPGNIAAARFLSYAEGNGMRAVVADQWYTTAEDLRAYEKTSSLYTEAKHAREAILHDSDRHVAHLRLDSDGEFYVTAAAKTTDLARQCVEAVRDHFPRRELAEDDPRVPVTFWSLGAHGPQNVERLVGVPAWRDVAGNYPPAVQDALDRSVMAPTFSPGTRGQIILWQGDPGTGKTYALRALAWEWRKWCSLHYITDPEDFFGRSAAYMMQVILGQDDSPAKKGEQRDPRAEGGRWRLLVLEDAGELMSADAKERAGAGLGRLLNVVDGLIGQGLRILVLVTTNEEVRRLHPAVTRPGRAASVVRFPKFDRPEAAVWMAEHGKTHEDLPRDPSTYTAADLFALRDGHPIADHDQVGMGFTER